MKSRPESGEQEQKAKQGPRLLGWRGWHSAPRVGTLLVALQLGGIAYFT